MESKVHLMQPKVEPPSQFCLWSLEPPLYSQSSRISEPLPWQNCLCIHMQDLDFLSFSFIFNLTLLVFTWHYKSENSFDCYFSHLSNISKIGKIHKFGKLEHLSSSKSLMKNIEHGHSSPFTSLRPDYRLTSTPSHSLIPW